MPLQTATITGKFLDPAQQPRKRFHLILEAATSNGMIKDANGTTVFSGRRKLYPDQYGNISVTIPKLPQAGVTPVGARWRIRFPNQLNLSEPNWIDEQMALPASGFDLGAYLQDPKPAPATASHRSSWYGVAWSSSATTRAASAFPNEWIALSWIRPSR